MEVSVVDLKPTQVIGLTRTGYYKIIAEMIPVLCEYAVSKETKITGVPIFICHETAEEAMEASENGTAKVEIAIPVSCDVEETDEIKNYTLPGGKFAKIVHKGRYEDCGPAYTQLFKWIEENNHRITGPTREYYINDPREVKPEEILTEIYAPIK